MLRTVACDCRTIIGLFISILTQQFLIIPSHIHEKPSKQRASERERKWKRVSQQIIVVKSNCRSHLELSLNKWQSVYSDRNALTHNTAIPILTTLITKWESSPTGISMSCEAEGKKWEREKGRRWEKRREGDMVCEREKEGREKKQKKKQGHR